MSFESPAKSGSLLKAYRFKVDQFDRMIAADVFGDRARIELRNGLLVVEGGVPRKQVVKTQSGMPLYKLSTRQVDAMLDLGIVSENVRAELLEGVLVKKMVKKHPHNFAMMQLSELLRELLPAEWKVAAEISLALHDSSRPEPDLSVVRGPIARYRGRNLTVADVGLLIEVAESSYSEDRRVKGRAYASAGIPTYWIVNLNDRRIEVFTEPQGSGKLASYRKEEHYGPEAEVPVVLEGNEIGRILAGEILPGG
ncbi:MAG: hypothetical protein NVSMB14_13750 [Isosphaeraceae bacterium]